MNKNMQTSAISDTNRSASTYAVYGLTECEMLIPAGNARLRIHFSGGSLSALGSVPATYSTRSRMVMRLIEGSPLFKQGRIRKIL